jgi:hypothetical protein
MIKSKAPESADSGKQSGFGQSQEDTSADKIQCGDGGDARIILTRSGFRMSRIDTSTSLRALVNPRQFNKIANTWHVPPHATMIEGTKETQASACQWLLKLGNISYSIAKVE